MKRVKRLAVMGALAGAMALPATAFAQTTTTTYELRHDPTTVQVSGSNATRAPEVAGTSQSRGSTLAFTGADIAEMTLFGAGAIGAGAFLVRRSRQRTA